MIAIGLLFVHMLCDYFKSRPQLEAEIVILRHQLNLLQRRAPRRPHLRATPAHETHADPVSDRPRGFTRWLTATNHKDIGTLYLFATGVFGLMSVLLSIIMRLELQSPGVQWLVDSSGNPDGQLYNAILSAHGLYMMFFLVIPAMFGGFGNYF